MENSFASKSQRTTTDPNAKRKVETSVAWGISHRTSPTHKHTMYTYVQNIRSHVTRFRINTKSEMVNYCWCCYRFKYVCLCIAGHCISTECAVSDGMVFERNSLQIYFMAANTCAEWASPFICHLCLLLKRKREKKNGEPTTLEWYYAVHSVIYWFRFPRVHSCAPFYSIRFNRTHRIRRASEKNGFDCWLSSRNHPLFTVQIIVGIKAILFWQFVSSWKFQRP